MFAFLHSLWFRIRSRFRRDILDAELAEEMRLHEELLREDARRGGASPEEARRAAAYRFGNATSTRERTRAAWSWGWIDALLQDLKYALRFLRRSPGFTTVAVLSLALGIGANATVFAVADKLLFSAPAHVAKPDALYLLNIKRASTNRPDAPFHPVAHFPEYFLLREQAKSLSAMAIYLPPERVRLGRGPDAPRIKESLVSVDFFDVLGVRPVRGRLLQPDDDTDSRSVHAAVISYQYWQRQFGGADSAIGTRFTTSDLTFEVVGITPDGFGGLELDAADVWVPLGATASVRVEREWKVWRGNVPKIVVRLRPNVLPSAASAEITVLLNRLPDREDRGATTETAQLGPIIQSRGPADQGAAVKVSTRLAVAAALVLIAACANLANLLLVRAISRRREIALRLAIGISRFRLVSQMLIESLLLAVAGTLAAVLFAKWGGDGLRTLVFPEMQWASGSVNARVFLYSMLGGTVVAVLATIIPAVRMTRADVGTALRSGAPQLTSSTGKLRQGLLAIQVALSLVLIVGALAFSRSLNRAYQFDMGLDVDRIIATRFFVETDSMSVPERTLALEEIARRVRLVPGVERAALASSVPLSGNSMGPVFPGNATSKDLFAAKWDMIPELQQTVGLRLVRGRWATREDVAPGSTPVTLLSETAARRFFPGVEAIGQCVRFGGDTMPCMQVVGIMRDLRTRSIREDAPFSMIAVTAKPGVRSRLAAYVIVRAKPGIDVDALVAPIRNSLLALRPDLATLEVRPLAKALDSDYRPLKLGAASFGSFAALAILLAAIGLYGILAFSVTQRTSEFGIRSALGARAAHIVRTVVGEGLIVVGVGATAGVLLSWYASTAIAALLFESSARDIAPYAYAAGVLGLVALVAAAVPAWRATRIDPAIALRAE